MVGYQVYIYECGDSFFGDYGNLVCYHDGLSKEGAIELKKELNEKGIKCYIKNERGSII